MNQNQKRILIAVIAVVVAMLAYPPFQVIASNGVVFNMGYDWLIAPPKRGYVAATVNASMLLIQWIGVLVVGGIAFFLTKDSMQEAQVSSYGATPSIHEQPEAPQPISTAKKPPTKFMPKRLLTALGVIVALIAAGIGGQVGKEVGKTVFSSKQSPQEIEAKLIEGFTVAANQINQKSPMMIDQDTRLDKATVGPGARVVYHHTFPKYSSRDIDANWLNTNLRPEVMRKVCASSGMKKSLQDGGTYVYIYSGSDGNEIARFEIDRNDCGFPPISEAAVNPETSTPATTENLRGPKYIDLGTFTVELLPEKGGMSQFLQVAIHSKWTTQNWNRLSPLRALKFYTR